MGFEICVRHAVLFLCYKNGKIHLKKKKQSKISLTFADENYRGTWSCFCLFSRLSNTLSSGNLFQAIEVGRSLRSNLLLLSVSNLRLLKEEFLLDRKASLTRREYSPQRERSRDRVDEMNQESPAVKCLVAGPIAVLESSLRNQQH